MVLEQAELEMVRNQRLVMINPEMVTITKTEYDLLIEIKKQIFRVVAIRLFIMSCRMTKN
ncbi:TPA: hypothetical protein VHA87_000410 [Streptococcus pyogenes]|nr:hypothetical protein [Streptococcus pyogenes]HER9084149.1 hypothetical protein [Streptococcus pyogenes]